jgi:hypothetical protein
MSGETMEKWLADANQRIAKLENELATYTSAEANDPKTWPTVLKQMKLIGELEAYIAEKSVPLDWYEKAQAENERLRNKFTNAVTRMDRARHILTDGKPTPGNNWGMLDTSDLVD